MDGKAMMTFQPTSNYSGGGATMALPPTINNNQLMYSSWVSNDGRMRWRMTAAEEMRWM
jgi:hypothetical protein